MKSIYASKLYKASTRKDRIHAALLAPGNLSLVQQLAEDLDEEYQVPENLGQPAQKAQAKPEVDEVNEGLFVDEEVDPEKDLMTMEDLKSPKPSSKPSPAHFSAPSTGKPDLSEKPEKTQEKADTSNLMPDSPATDVNNDKKEETAASTKITSVTQVNPTQISLCALEDIDLNVIKGSLNGREDTAGVNRISEKENEVWIYYNDDINLNDKMTAVIEYLANAGHDNLEFNRLARSDNAIVFVITKTVRDYPDKSIESGEKTA